MIVFAGRVHVDTAALASPSEGHAERREAVPYAVMHACDGERVEGRVEKVAPEAAIRRLFLGRADSEFLSDLRLGSASN